MRWYRRQHDGAAAAALCDGDIADHAALPAPTAVALAASVEAGRTE
jgi:hypothetical protein